MSDENFDFGKFLEQDTSAIKRPNPIPGGTYLFMVGQKKFDKSTDKKTPYVEYELIPQSYEADVDATDLEKSLNGETLQEKKLRATFYFTDKATYRLLDFGKACGIEIEGVKLSDLVNKIEGSYVKGFVTIKRDANNPSSPGFNNVDRFISAS